MLQWIHGIGVVPSSMN